MTAEMLRSHHLSDDWEPVLVIYFMTHLFKSKMIFLLLQLFIISLFSLLSFVVLYSIL